MAGKRNLTDDDADSRKTNDGFQYSKKYLSVVWEESFGVEPGQETCADWIKRIDSNFSREMLIRIPADDDAEYLQSLGVQPL